MQLCEEVVECPAERKIVSGLYGGQRGRDRSLRFAVGELSRKLCVKALQLVDARVRAFRLRFGIQQIQVEPLIRLEQLEDLGVSRAQNAFFCMASVLDLLVATEEARMIRKAHGSNKRSERTDSRLAVFQLPLERRNIGPVLLRPLGCRFECLEVLHFQEQVRQLLRQGRDRFLVGSGAGLVSARKDLASVRAAMELVPISGAI